MYIMIFYERVINNTTVLVNLKDTHGMVTRFSFTHEHGASE